MDMKYRRGWGKGKLTPVIKVNGGKYVKKEKKIA